MIACEHCGTYTHAPVIVCDRLRGSDIETRRHFCSPACELAWWRLTIPTDI